MDAEVLKVPILSGRCTRGTCGAPARFFPKILLYPLEALYPNVPPAGMILGLPLCEDCCRLVTIEDLVPYSSQVGIAARMVRAGRPCPDPKRTKLVFVAIDSEEAKLFVQLVNPAPPPESTAVH